MRRITAETASAIRYLVITIMMVFMAPGLFEGRKVPTDTRTNTFEAREILCVISLGDDMRGPHGLESGFCYELLERFASDNSCTITTIVESDCGEMWIDSLRNGTIDMMVVHPEIHDCHDDINFSHRLTSCSSCATAGKNINEIRQINNWLSHIMASGDYSKLRTKYFRSFDPIKRAESGEISGTISPYDDLIKKHASELGWDWRMLAAVVYQESKFSISSRSHRGAQGLMQVMPQTAKYYDISNLTDPDRNLSAGTNHLKRLQKMLGKYGMEQEELIKFTLAAYNAGEGRIIDLRNLAAAMQIDTCRWEAVAGIIPLMREDSILEEASVRLGKFNGEETIEYVGNVMSLYEAICSICPQG